VPKQAAAVAAAAAAAATPATVAGPRGSKRAAAATRAARVAWFRNCQAVCVLVVLGATFTLALAAALASLVESGVGRCGAAMDSCIARRGPRDAEQ
jgi:hypothetical protein